VLRGAPVRGTRAQPWGARSRGRNAISNNVAGPVAALINEFSKLPTIGPKTAARLVFHLLNKPRADAESLADAIVALKDRVRLCSNCFSITEEDPCAICGDSRRDASILCVVAEAKDIYSLERTSAYNGRYHVLGGLISPMDGIGPAQLRVKELIERIGSNAFTEVIVATNPNAEGEATALYLSRLITPLGVVVTRLAYGLPIGGDLDYADEVTLAKALEGRRALG
jgi:recombination protein RecR